MAKGKTPETAIKYINFLRKQEPGIIKAYLFGSYAKGNADINSDMDIAIIFEDFPDSFDMQVQLMKLRRKFDTRIEPHPFRRKDFNISNPMANEILKTGIEIEGSDPDNP
jgi:predicted nucleotidyltransferase